MRLKLPATAERMAANLLKLEKAASRIPPTNRPFRIAPNRGSRDHGAKSAAKQLIDITYIISHHLP